MGLETEQGVSQYRGRWASQHRVLGPPWGGDYEGEAWRTAELGPRTTPKWGGWLRRGLGSLETQGRRAGEPATTPRYRKTASRQCAGRKKRRWKKQGRKVEAGSGGGWMDVQQGQESVFCSQSKARLAQFMGTKWGWCFREREVQCWEVLNCPRDWIAW